MTRRAFQYIRSKKFKIRRMDAGSIHLFKVGCPICDGGHVVVNVIAWELDKWGWVATEIEVNCNTEPDIESEDWEDWFNWHYSMPYVDWLPVNTRVLRSLQKFVRFVKRPK